MKMWSILKKWTSNLWGRKEAKTIDEVVFELALICAVPQEPYLNLFLVSGLKEYSASHFAFSREATAYMGGRLGMRLKGEIPLSQQESRVGHLAGNVAKIHVYLLRKEGWSDVCVPPSTSSC